MIYNIFYQLLNFKRHGVNLNRQLTKVKHEVRKTLFMANHLVKVNVWKIAIIGLLGLIIMRKDISISLKLKSPMNTEMATAAEVPTSVKSELVKQVATNPNARTSTQETNTKITINRTKQERSQFPNIAFILHPTYAKRNNIDPKIVAQNNKNCTDYVKRFSAVAVKEMKKYGIPASITLAQGLLESDAGMSGLATYNKNHFGIKCFAKDCREGHCSNHSDDSHKDFFRNYKTDWESYRAHSLFLQRSRYQHLRKFSHSDYKSWARGLSKAGYATDKKYADKLISLIENMNLQRFDK